MKKTRIQVSISPRLVARAHELMEVRNYDSFSEFLEDMIRQESDRRSHPSAPASVKPLDASAANIPPQSTNPNQSALAEAKGFADGTAAVKKARAKARP